MHESGSIVIVVLPRGFVVVGEWWQEGRYITIKNGGVVRRWGTTEGLGELARKGRLRETTIDPSPDMKFVETAVVMTHVCSEAWTNAVKDSFYKLKSTSKQ